MVIYKFVCVKKYENVIKIQKIIRGYLIRKSIDSKRVRSLLESIDYKQFTKMLHETHCMEDNNMNRFIKSEMRERTLAKLLPNSKYVGNNAVFEADIIYPNVSNINKHIKLEVKCMKKLLNKDGNTKGIIIKNGRGKGTKVMDLLDSVMKNIFVLIDTQPPFSISYCHPTNLLFYVTSKKKAKKYKDMDIELLNTQTAELKAYINKTDLIMIRNHLIDYNYVNTGYNPVEDMLESFTERYIGP